MAGVLYVNEGRCCPLVYPTFSLHGRHVDVIHHSIQLQLLCSGYILCVLSCWVIDAVFFFLNHETVHFQEKIKLHRNALDFTERDIEDLVGLYFYFFSCTANVENIFFVLSNYSEIFTSLNLCSIVIPSLQIQSIEEKLNGGLLSLKNYCC